MSDIAIRVENLSKLYHIGAAQKRHDTLRDAIVDAVSAPLMRLRDRRPTTVAGHPSSVTGRDDTLLWALKDVSFDVKRGEVIGIIGRNGAGKSTLLKILSRITEPTAGRAEIHGRVGSLLEVGTGFHPELTGRENIYLNGAILGMRRTEIERKFDEIVAFAEIEKFLDTPVKRYSSGMYVRLAFAVAAHLEPEILLVDEVLAVGDAQFQKKCLGKMGDVAKEGRTVLFVSHNMVAIEGLCGQALLLHDGAVTSRGPAPDVIKTYIAMALPKPHIDGRAVAEDPRSGVKLLALHPIGPHGEPISAVRSGDDLFLLMDIECAKPIPNAVLTVGLNDIYGARATVLHSEIAGFSLALAEGRNRAICQVARFPLVPGRYGMDVYLLAGTDGLLWAPSLGPLEIVEGDFYGSGRSPNPRWAGHCYVQQQWEVAPA